MKKLLAIAVITIVSITAGFSQNTVGIIDADYEKPVRRVPDGGTTVLLLGAALSGLYVASRKFAKA